METPEAASPIARAVARPVGVSMVVAALVVFGIVSFAHLPYQLLPEISYPRLTVRTVYPGGAPEDVEERISRPLEDSLSVLKDLRSVRSISRADVSEIRLEFNWGADVTTLVADAREKVDQTFLPQEAERPTILRYDPRLEPVIVLALSGGQSVAELRELRFVAEEYVERELETVPGTAAVKVRGGLEEEVIVALDEKKLASYGFEPGEILQKLRTSNINAPAGRVQKGDRSFLVRVLNEFQGLDEIQNLVLDSSRDVRVGHVATVDWSHRDPDVISRLDGQSCVRIEVYREADVNPVELARAVKEWTFGSPGVPPRVKVPEGRTLSVVSDQSIFIAGAIRDVTQALLQGGLLAAFVLFIFLRDLRSTLLVALSIPISIAITFMPLFLSGVSLNIMSLGGLALGAGMLVDNAIVATESIARCGGAGLSRRASAIQGTREVAGAVTASTLTTIAVFFPIVFVSGVGAQIFRDQALAVIFALLASLGVALYFLPTMISSGGEEASERAARFPWPRGRSGWLGTELHWARMRPLPGFLLAPILLALFLIRLVLILVAWVGAACFRVALSPVRGVVRLVTLLERNKEERSGFALAPPYDRSLARCLRHPWRVLAVAVVLGGAALLAGRQVGSELIPELAQGEFVLHVRLPVGTPIETTDALLTRFARAIKDSPDVRHVGTTAGVDPEDIQATGEGPHTGRLYIRLRRTDASYRVAEERVRRLLGRCLSDPLIEERRFARPLLFVWEGALVVELRGKDLGALKEQAEKVEEVLRGIPLLEEPENSMRAGHPEIHITFDRRELARRGLTVGAAAQALRRKIQGEVGTYFPEPTRTIDIRVRLRQGRELARSELAELVIGYYAGRGVRLREVAAIEAGQGPAEIRRHAGQRCAIVSASVPGLDLGRAGRVATETLGRTGITNVSLVGQSQQMAESRTGMLWALALAVFLVYVVMASQFENLLAPFVILFSVPLAFVGVAFAMYLGEIRLSVVVFIGFVMLAGIVVNNAIVMVDYIGRLRRNGLSVDAAIRVGATARLRPILMTTLTTILGLIPFTGALSAVPHPEVLDVLLGSGQGQELRGPLAWTVITGLGSSTLLTLFIVPVLYRLLVGRRAL